jgi:hypothetical protein
MVPEVKGFNTQSSDIPDMHEFAAQIPLWVILGFRRVEDENCALLDYYAASSV